jgi:hypothetical protein
VTRTWRRPSWARKAPPVVRQAPPWSAAGKAALCNSGRATRSVVRGIVAVRGCGDGAACLGRAPGMWFVEVEPVNAQAARLSVAFDGAVRAAVDQRRWMQRAPDLHRHERARAEAPRHRGSRTTRALSAGARPAPLRVRGQYRPALAARERTRGSRRAGVASVTSRGGARRPRGIWIRTAPCSSFPAPMRCPASARLRPPRGDRASGAASRGRPRSIVSSAKAR